MLASIEKFEASQEDFALFKWIEKKVFRLFRLWLESFSGVTDGGLEDELSGIIPEDISFDVQFSKPADNVSSAEKYDLAIKKVEDGTMSMLELVMMDRDVDEDKAREILENIREERAENMLMGRALNANRDEDAFGEEPEA